ncbi:MAG: glutamate formimidoyltransferase [Myxococcota bacterium]|nr:glutamate formimidoyltransferase [Myxococcota bacterium]
MTPIVECVPNFSEGRDPVIIEAIAGAIRTVSGVALLDVDPGEATNRTVMTMVGAPEVVLEAAFQAIKTAAARIDMRSHSGAHPRMGATDVCPFVPVSGITMAQCADLARRLGERVGAELSIPVYLYEAAASRPERQNLATVRAGEYEGLADKLKDPVWAPDFGPTSGALTAGATVIGARPFLIAFNVNLNTTETRRAMKVAALIREKGILRRDEDNEIVRDADGKGLRDPGMFKCVKAIGWYIEEYGRCQVSINFTDYTVSPPHLVVDAIRRVADQEGLVVTGSELVGLVPLEAMLSAGRHYLRRQRLNPGANEAELIEIAIRSLGLRELGDFDPNERIIERRIRQDGPLVTQTVRGFVDQTSSRAPAPGGGSVAALCGALSTALSAMVGGLTTGKSGYESQFAAQDEMAIAAQGLKEGFLADIDADTAAFDGMMAAMRLPKGTDDEKKARSVARRAANIEGVEVPLRVLERCIDAVAAAEQAAQGNKNARSDAGVAALTAMAAAEGAWYNVNINLSGMRDKPLVAGYRARADAALDEVTRRTDALRADMRAQLRG